MIRFLTTIAACLALISLTPPSHAQTPPPTPIDLTLFEKSEIDRSKGCSVALWQANRDPDTDKHAYLFMENLGGQNHARQPARIKIGDDVVRLTRVAVGDAALMDPKWDLKSRVVTGIHTEGNGADCGQYERYQVTPEGDFKLIEFRSKDKCDGRRMAPTDYPLLFKAPG